MRAILSLVAYMTLFLACSSVENDISGAHWKVLLLEHQIHDLEVQNEKLSITLNKIDPQHISIRNFTHSLVRDLEVVKQHIIAFATRESDFSINHTHQRMSIKGLYYPRTFSYATHHVPRQLHKLVVHCMTAFDHHPATDSRLLDSFADINLDKNTWSSDVGESIQLLELSQLELLIAENQYLTQQLEDRVIWSK